MYMFQIFQLSFWERFAANVPADMDLNRRAEPRFVLLYESIFFCDMLIRVEGRRH